MAKACEPQRLGSDATGTVQDFQWMTATLRRLLLGDVLSPASRERLTGWMRNCKTGLDLLRAGLPKGWSVADKTGNDGKAMLVDIAVAWPAIGKPLLITAYIDGGPVNDCG